MTDLYIQSDGRDMTVWDDRHFPPKALLTEHQAGPVLWAHLVATLPTRDDPQPEPTDPAVRVRDGDGREWARVRDAWVSDLHTSIPWAELQSDYGPLTIIPPVPDAEPEARPFQVGDRVRVADDAMTPNGQESSLWRGHSGVLTRRSRSNPDCWVVDGIKRVRTRHLAHADPA